MRHFICFVQERENRTHDITKANSRAHSMYLKDEPAEPRRLPSSICNKCQSFSDRHSVYSVLAGQETEKQNYDNQPLRTILLAEECKREELSLKMRKGQILLQRRCNSVVHFSRDLTSHLNEPNEGT